VPFEWEAANIAKHGVSFSLALRIFDGPVMTAEDTRADYGERRMISVGRAAGAVILTVVHTDRQGRTRLISARPASTRERRKYDEAP